MSAPQGEARLVERLLAGDRRALARLVSLVEAGDPALPAIMREVHARGGQAYTVGVTGPPGAGKSTLVDRMIAELRAAGDTVGVVAVDPTSPFSGGAVLGDRIRMQAHALDPGVFIRSMATRGSLGGLSRATTDAQKLLDAAGFAWVLVETVGVGQSELDVAALADTTVVVLVPESGDGIQAMKAGLLEVADIFVVNKADRDGAGRLATELRQMVHVHRDGQQASRDLDWEVPVLETRASQGTGVDELVATIRRHRAAQEAGSALARRRARRRTRDLRELLVAALRAEVEAALGEGGALAGLLAEVEAGRLDAYTARGQALERLLARPAARRDLAGQPGPSV